MSSPAEQTYRFAYATRLTGKRTLTRTRSRKRPVGSGHRDRTEFPAAKLGAPSGESLGSMRQVWSTGPRSATDEVSLVVLSP